MALDTATTRDIGKYPSIVHRLSMSAAQTMAVVEAEHIDLDEILQILIKLMCDLFTQVMWSASVKIARKSMHCCLLLCRGYCSRRLRRLRKTLGFKMGNRHKFIGKKITVEMLSDNRWGMHHPCNINLYTLLLKHSIRCTARDLCHSVESVSTHDFYFCLFWVKRCLCVLGVLFSASG